MAMVKSLAVAGLWAGVAVAASQVSFTGSWQESFDGLPTASTFSILDNWQNNATLPGWSRLLISDGTPGVETRFRVDDGNATGGSMWSLGAFGSTERALGFTPSSNLPTGHIAVELINSTGAVIRDLAIRYTGEQWRRGVDGDDALTFSYRRGGIDLTSGMWQAEDSLTFDAPQTTGGPVRLDGNAAGNRRLIAGTLINLDWQPGESLWLRWTGVDRLGADHTLAIDDLQVEAVPEPVTLAVMAGMGIGALRRRRSRAPRH